MPLKRQVASRHELLMHQLKDSPPGESHLPKRHCYMRRQCSMFEAEQANALYKSLGGSERWKMEKVV